MVRTYCLLTVGLLYYSALPCFAGEPVFADDSEQIVEQILKGEKKYSKTRSFVVVGTAGAAIAQRSIKVKARSKLGEDETIMVTVPVSGTESAARLKIEFDVNSARLRSSAYPLLSELGAALRDVRVSEQKICIKGHTDSDGEQGYNRDLSYERANSVLSYLLGAQSIPVDTIQVYGYGEEVPLVENDSQMHKQMNRRVEVSLNCPEVN